MRVRRGRAESSPTTRASALQRGRTRESAESSPRCRCARPAPWLQRGRTRESAESLSRVHVHPFSESFNEAALVRVRRGKSPPHAGPSRAVLQRGRTRESAERSRAGMRAPAGMAGFNEAALVRVRRGRARPSAQLGRQRFNVAALVRVRRGSTTHARPPKRSLLQRGRTRESAERARWTSTRNTPMPLQRGRTRESAERSASGAGS